MEIVIRKVHGYLNDPSGHCTLFVEVELAGTVIEEARLTFTDQHAEVVISPSVTVGAPLATPGLRLSGRAMLEVENARGLRVIEGGRS